MADATNGRPDNLDFRYVARIGAILGTGLGLLVLVGWSLGNEALKSVRPGLRPMSVATALCFVFGGVVLLQPFAGSSPSRPAIRLGGAGLICAIAGYALVTYLVGFPNAGFVFGTAAGNVSAATAAAFLLFASALLAGERLGGHLYASLIAVGLLVSGLAVTGYAFGVAALYSFAPYSAVALH